MMRRSLVALLPLALLLTVLVPGSAAALASFQFVSSAGQFSIAGDTLSFGNGLTISVAEADGVGDMDLVGATILLDSIALTGDVTDLGGGFSEAGLVPGQMLSLQIYQAPADGGALLATADYDPGDFVVFGASGSLSAPIGGDLSNVTLTAAGMGFSSVLDQLAATNLPIDFNVGLSAAGQDLAARIDAGALAVGSVAGSVAIVPEPSTIALTGLGLSALAWRSRRRAQTRAAREAR